MGRKSTAVRKTRSVQKKPPSSKHHDIVRKSTRKKRETAAIRDDLIERPNAVLRSASKLRKGVVPKIIKESAFLEDDPDDVHKSDEEHQLVQLNKESYEKWKKLKVEQKFTSDNQLAEYLFNVHLERKRYAEIPRESSHEESPENAESETKNEMAAAQESKTQDLPIETKQESESPPPPPGSSSGLSSETEPPEAQKTRKRVKKDANEIKTRRKISQYDCRRTPSGGLPEAKVLSKANSKAKGAWCRDCDGSHVGQQACPLADPVCVVTDSVIDFSTKNNNESSEQEGVDKRTYLESSNPAHGLDLSKSFAQLSLPSPLQLQERDSTHGLSVITRACVKAFTQFGPLQGEEILERDIPDDFHMKDLWQVIRHDKSRLFLSTVNPEKSNWLRYLCPAPERPRRNLAAVVKEDKLFFVTLRDLRPNEELLYWTDDPSLMWTKKRAEKKNCGGCNLRFSHPLYYRLHCTVFHDPLFSLTIRKYHCKVCGLSVLGKENIVKHASEAHDGRGAYQCQYCKKYFLRLNYLEMHRTYGCSSNPGRTRPLCDLCGRKFCQPQKLKVHMKRMHSDNSESLADFRCPLCSKVLGSKNAILRHKKEVHSDVIPDDKRTNGTVPTKVDCPKCEKTFKNKSNLKIHMLTHSGVKPFGCKIEGCNSGFTTKQCLQFHYKKTHKLEENAMPKIVREIPYTLSAYSGGCVSSSSTASEDETSEPNEEGPTKSDPTQSSQTSPMETYISKYSSKKLSERKSLETIAKSSSSDPKDDDGVYAFDDDEEQPALRKAGTMGVTEMTATPPASASLLVEAALSAAELDLQRGQSEAVKEEAFPAAGVGTSEDSNNNCEDSIEAPNIVSYPMATSDMKPPEDNSMGDGFPQATFNLGEANRAASLSSSYLDQPSKSFYEAYDDVPRNDGPSSIRPGYHHLPSISDLHNFSHNNLYSWPRVDYTPFPPRGSTNSDYDGRDSVFRPSSLDLAPPPASMDLSLSLPRPSSGHAYGGEPALLQRGGSPEPRLQTFGSSPHDHRFLKEPPLPPMPYPQQNYPSYHQSPRINPSPYQPSPNPPRLPHISAPSSAYPPPPHHYGYF